MGDFVPLEVHSVNVNFESEYSKENKYKFVYGEKEDWRISGVGFVICKEEKLVVASGYHIKIFSINSIKDELVKPINLGSFRNEINCFSFRSDGKLIAVATKGGECYIIDIQTRSTLRRLIFEGESLTAITFSEDRSKIIGGSTNGKLIVWDIATGDKLIIKDIHNDIIKSIILINSEYNLDNNNIISNNSSINLSKDIFATCSYDGTIRLWCISKISNSSLNKLFEDKFELESIKEYKHEAPVECLKYITSGILVSAGGTSVKLWNIKDKEENQSPILMNFCNFGRTVTSLDINGDIILAGSLDRNLSFLNIKSFEILNSFHFLSGIQGVAISKNANYILIALEDGNWICRQKSITLSNNLKKQDKYGHSTQSIIRTGTLKYFKRGRNSKPDISHINISAPKKKITKLNRLLKAYAYGKALDLALNISWLHVLTILETLSSRGALHIVFKDLSKDKLLSILKMLSRSIGRCNPSHYCIIAEAIQHILNESNWQKLFLFSSDTSKSITEITDAVKRLIHKVTLEIQQHNILKELDGMIELILSNCNNT
ncbi:hypothetical protein ACR3K2_38150 [Cryptosporidium serpentis]